MAPSVDAINQSEFGQDYYSSGLRAKYNIEVARLTAPTSQRPQKAADIAYEPNISSYLARSSARTCSTELEKDVPEGWPKALSGPMAWTGSDFMNESEWLYTLSSNDKKEVNSALGHFKSENQYLSPIIQQPPSHTSKLTLAGLGLPFHKVSKESFPLPSLASLLLKTCDDIYQGRGFAVIRGLNPNEYTPEDFAVIFLGISGYIAERRGKQDRRGTMMSN